MYIKSLIIFFSLCILVGCSGNPKNAAFIFQKREIKDYKITDSSHEGFPLWVTKPQKIGSETSDPNYYYFAFETAPKISRKIACNLLKAYGREKIVQEAYEFATIGSPENIKTLLKESGETLAMKNFRRTSIVETYWEERLYPPLPEHVKYREGATCAFLIKVKRSEIARIFRSYEVLIGKNTRNRSFVEDFRTKESKFFRYRQARF